MVLREAMPLVRGSFSIYVKRERDVFRKSGLKEGDVIGKGFIFIESGRDGFRKSGLK